MGLTISKEQFENSYQTIFQDVLVAMEVCNTELRTLLEYGSSVARPRAIIDGVRVRDYTAGSNYTIDQTADEKESLIVNKLKVAVVRVDRTEKVQMKNLSPSEFFGTQIALKVSTYVDGDALALSRGFATFDAGNIGGTAGQPIDLGGTSPANPVEKTSAKAYATVRSLVKGKLLTNMVWVIDSLAAGDIEVTLMGKSIELATAVWKNGFAGPLRTASLYVSENLAADFSIEFTTQPTAGQTLVIGAFTYTFVATIGSTEGNVLIGAAAANTRANLVAALNMGAGAGTTYVAWTDVSPTYNQSLWAELRLTATDNVAGTQVDVVTIGSGRLAISGTALATIGGLNYSFINSPYMVKGAFDVVAQEKIEGESIPDPFQMADIVRSFTMYGVKLFKDGIKQGVNVKIKA
jgi:hypothetical protein